MQARSVSPAHTLVSRKCQQIYLLPAARRGQVGGGASAQPGSSAWEATGGPSPEPGEGSRCQTHFELMVTGALVAALHLIWAPDSVLAGEQAVMSYFPRNMECGWSP